MLCLGSSPIHPNDIVRGILVRIHLRSILAAWVFVCYCVVPTYVGVVIIFIMYAP
jgi:hypothetical protein